MGGGEDASETVHRTMIPGRSNSQQKINRINHFKKPCRTIILKAVGIRWEYYTSRETMLHYKLFQERKQGRKQQQTKTKRRKTSPWDSTAIAIKNCANASHSTLNSSYLNETNVLKEIQNMGRFKYNVWNTQNRMHLKTAYEENTDHIWLFYCAG